MPFILDPASKFKDPGQMIEFARHQGVCTSAEESDRRWGVFSIYQPFSSDSAEKAREHSHAEPILGSAWPGSCTAKMENSVHADFLCFLGAKK